MSNRDFNWKVGITVSPAVIVTAGLFVGWLVLLASWFMDKFFERLEGLLR